MSAAHVAPVLSDAELAANLAESLRITARSLASIGGCELAMRTLDTIGDELAELYLWQGARRPAARIA